ncbi:MAG: hypothetical protein DRQ39_03325 [Gammaproteobacteria bacterium]|nr:MAG: hypothetical protein DRQ39_03325 [Gammaproteobacteria bacterium]
MKIVLFVLVGLFSGISWAENQIETIQINHRLAEEILPEIKAFLPQNATARASNEFIIIKAEPNDIKELKQLINTLDTPLQRLKVTVLRTDEALSGQQAFGVNADVIVGNQDSSGSVSVRKWSTQHSQNKDQYYQAQGIAGRPITITIGQEIPEKEQQRFILFSRQSETYYLNVDSGFKAVARILPNNQVTVDIHPQFSQYNKNDGSVDRSQIISSISGPAGTWLELGKIDNAKNRNENGATTYYSHQSLQEIIYIKVEELSQY